MGVWGKYREGPRGAGQHTNRSILEFDTRNKFCSSIHSGVTIITDNENNLKISRREDLSTFTVKTHWKFKVMDGFATLNLSLFNMYTNENCSHQDVQVWHANRHLRYAKIRYLKTSYDYGLVSLQWVDRYRQGAWSPVKSLEATTKTQQPCESRAAFQQLFEVWTHPSRSKIPIQILK